MPAFILGTINAPGRIISVIDPKRFFGLPEKGLTDLNTVILISDGKMEFGLLADAVLGVSNISLAALGQEHGLKIPEGRLHASCALKGPFKDWQIAGAWWLSDLQWGEAPVGEARGDLELSREHFQAEAKSANSRFRFALEGRRSDKTVDVADPGNGARGGHGVGFQGI